MAKRNRLAMLMAKRQMNGKTADSPLAVVPPPNADGIKGTVLLKPNSTLTNNLQYGRKATISQHASTEFLTQPQMQ